MEPKKISGWDVKEMRNGGVMDKGEKLSLHLVGADGQKRTIFLPCLEANTAINLILSLLKNARAVREQLGIQDDYAQKDLQTQQHKVANIAIASDERGTSFAVRIETDQGMSWVYAMDRSVAVSLAEGLVSALTKHGIALDLAHSGVTKH